MNKKLIMLVIVVIATMGLAVPTFAQDMMDTDWPRQECVNHPGLETVTHEGNGFTYDCGQYRDGEALEGLEDFCEEVDNRWVDYDGIVYDCDVFDEPQFTTVEIPEATAVPDEPAVTEEPEVQDVALDGDMFEIMAMSYDEFVAQYPNSQLVSRGLFQPTRGQNYRIDRQTWQLVLETYFASTTDNGRWEAVMPEPSNLDVGFCNEGQRDCTNHSQLIRVAVPREFDECISTEMEIAHRIYVGSQCEEWVPIFFGARYNLLSVTDDEQWGLTAEELAETYANLAGGNPAWMFSSHQSVDGLTFVLFADWLGEGIPFEYGCSDCLADTLGVDAIAVPLADTSTTGPDTVPLGHTSLSALSVAIPDEWDWQFNAVIMIPPVGDAREVALNIWIGEFAETSQPEIQGQSTTDEDPVGSVTIVATDGLNVRSEPSVNAPIMSVTLPDETLEVFDVQGNWVRVDDGWIRTGQGFSDYTPNSDE